jgi:predicted metal-dependent TIM-barrel fold hydrolase
MIEISQMGAYIGIFAYGDILNFNNPKCDPYYFIECINKIGAQHIFIASDLGTVVNVPPAEGMKLFVRILLATGMDKKTIRKMVVDNPRKLLGLD